jgi:hypothetical protein
MEGKVPGGLDVLVANAGIKSRYVTGIALPVDLGMSMKYSGA